MPQIQYVEKNGFPGTMLTRSVALRHVLGKTLKFGETAENGGTNENERTLETSPSAIGVWLKRRRLEQKLSVLELAVATGLSFVSIYNIESGRTNSPHRRTVAKLEAALNKQLSSEAKENANDAATIEGVGECFNFDPNCQSDWPTVAGIYVLYDVCDRPNYVGQGPDISLRLRDDYIQFWFRRPIVQYATFVRIDNRELREQIEKVLIKCLKLNAVLNQPIADRYISKMR
jgi:transcriptional regulator with XRE-family HTH domain